MGTEIKGEARQIQLPMDLKAPASARWFAAETLRRWDCEDLVDEVSLVVSEVVTNAVVHAQSDTTLTFLNMGDSLQVRVRDGESSPPKLKDSSESATDGRGIFLVEALCTAWGVDQAHPGKVVWLDISKDRNRHTV